jgi:putative transcriptional regulator
VNDAFLAGRRLTNTLREARMRHGMTQAELAIRVGVSRKTINTVENGIFIPSVFLALGLAAVLETGVETLFSIRAQS